MISNRDHWQTVYQTKGEQQTSWFRAHLDESLRLIDGVDPDKTLPAIDVGGGRSTLVDDLIERGYSDVTVLDLSQTALDESRQRLGGRGAGVAWIAADILHATLPVAHYSLWHDRAVFHFLTNAEERARYARLAASSLRTGGLLVLATFAADGPEKCSGLPVCRYEAAALATGFIEHFERIGDSRELHPTPFGTKQSFTYVVLRRNSYDVRSAHATE